MNFHIHKWMPWSEPVSASEYIKVQVRYCEVCNKCQAAKIKQPWNVWFDWSRK